MNFKNIENIYKSYQSDSILKYKTKLKKIKMFPPDSPQSPLDGPILITQENDNNTVQLRKPSDTLRNNIDLKEEIARKRTSLKIDNNSEKLKTANDNQRNTISHINHQRNDNDNHHHHVNNCRNDNDDLMNVNTRNDNDNNNKRHRISMTSSSNDDDDEEGDYNDMENGNTTDTQSHKTRDSIVSSEDLNVDAMNTRNDRISKDMGVTSFNELLSPDEGPMSRRYAEIASFKNW